MAPDLDKAAEVAEKVDDPRRLYVWVGVAVLLLPQFIPRAVVLYAAVLAKLKAAPFLAAVFVGTFLRNLLMLAAFSFIP